MNATATAGSKGKRGSWARWAAAWALLLGGGQHLVGCGSHGGVKPDGSTNITVTDGAVKVTPRFAECPDLVLAVSPVTAPAGGVITLSARVGGGDAGATYPIHWTASVGAPAQASGPSTTYTCPSADKASPVRLTAAIGGDGGCATSRSVTVSCIGSADASTDVPATNDAGAQDGGAAGAVGAGGSTGAGGNGAGGMMTGAGGGGGSCPGDPSLCEGTACNDCTFGPAGNCYDGTDGCQGLSSDADQQLCWTLYLCLRDRCAAADPTSQDPSNSWDTTQVCWCGKASAADQKCQTGALVADGVCAKEIAAAAKSSSPSDISLRYIDPNFPLGRAINLVVCRNQYCGKKTGPKPACPAW